MPWLHAVLVAAAFWVGYYCAKCASDEAVDLMTKRCLRLEEERQRYAKRYEALLVQSDAINRTVADLKRAIRAV